MKRFFILIFLLIGIIFIGFSYNLAPTDSVGMTSREGAHFIIHEVDAGETLFALSRKYSVTVQEIKNANEGELTSLSIGQKVLIPYVKKSNADNSKVHIVQSSETLFSISRNYNVQVEDIRKWNGLTDDNISVGQKLTITGPDPAAAQPGTVAATSVPRTGRTTHKVEESQTLYAISKMYGVTTDQLREWNNLSSNSLNIGQVLIVSASAQTAEAAKANSSMLPPKETSSQQNVNENPSAKTEATKQPTAKMEPVVAAPVVLNENTPADKIEAPAEKVMKKGMAEVIENSSDTKKYLALHREAPIGTIMQVKNEMNNQTVFVRVVGTIPDAGDNGKVILKISKKAYDRLGAVDNRFPVELSYIP